MSVHLEARTCVLCQDVDTDEMVACDTCESWTHYQCANIDHEVAEKESFECARCIESKEKEKRDEAVKAMNIESTGTATSGANAKDVYDEGAVLDSRSQNAQTSISAGLTSKKSNKNNSTNDHHSTKNKSISSKSSRTKAMHMLNVLEEQRKADQERDRLYFEQKMKIIATMGSSDSSSSEQGDEFQSSKNAFIDQWARDQQKVSFSEDCVNSRAVPTTKGAVSKRSRHINRDLSDTREALPWLSAINDSEFLNSTSCNSARAPKSNEASVRQISTKHNYDLPHFNGNVGEWPMFISSFVRSTTALKLSNLDNLDRLQKSLKGDALKLVRNSLVYEGSVPRVIAVLRKRFGRPDLILDEMIKLVRDVPKVNIDKMDTLLDFSLAVQQLCSTLEASGMKDHLNNPSLLQELVNKLPGNQKLDWAEYKLAHPPVTIATFDKWLCELSDKACTVMTDSKVNFSQTNARESEVKTSKRDKKKDYVHSTVDNNHIFKKSTNEQQSVQCIVCSKGAHLIPDCPVFVAKLVSDRWVCLKTYSLCRKCLKRHHWKECKSSKICGVNGCPFKHHSLLHDQAKHVVNDTRVNVTTNLITVHNSFTPAKVLFRVVPVVLYGPSSTINTFAFLDEGSSRTLLDEEVAKSLGITGPIEPLYLKWTSDVAREESQSRRVSLQLSGKGDNRKKYRLSNVRTVANLNLFSQTLEYNASDCKYSHLRNLPIESYENAKPQILIGIEHWKLGIPLQVREGKWGEPIAAKTRLGWTLFGCESERSNKVNIDMSFYINDCTDDDNLHACVKEFFTIESFGVKTPENVLISNDDQRALAILNKTTRKVNDKYESGLLWRYDNIQMPDSFDMALSRLKCLEKKMAKNVVLADTIKVTINDHVLKGYARKLTPDEINAPDSKKWYLPMFVVVNPNKPQKIRIVWDAAARIAGISLNSMLLKGPDLLCSLPEILYRFRERSVGLAGDIKEMYHQVGVIREDQNSQRFLWRDWSTNEVEVYAMNVMTFGASCSPSVAHYIKNKNALLFQSESPRAVEAILKNHYVDDWLQSFESDEDAVVVAKEVIRIHKSAGFEIRNWVSNSKNVVQNLGVQQIRHEPINLNINPETTGVKVLGLHWDTANDEFYFDLNSSRIDRELLIGLRCPTKREVLRILMLIYDPLGLISSYLVYVKILLQEIWRSNTDWDETIAKVHYEKWMKWTKLLPKIQDVRIPRCYFTSGYKSLQLHVFVDASNSAYGAAAYFRYTKSNGDVLCSLVSAKTKVAPLKPLSIPRLELQAAVLGARLSNSVQAGHTLAPERVVYWSDSIDVICWLRSDLRRYKQFVALRVSEILETTEVKEWRWVPTQQNPADEATKWKVKFECGNESRWYNGPKFLRLPESEWPVEQKKVSRVEDIEMKSQMHHVEEETPELAQLLARVSTWRKAYRVMAWVFRLMNNLRNKTMRNSNMFLDHSEFQRSKSALYRQAQRHNYSEEIGLLTEFPNKSVPKSSQLYKMSPFLDENKVLRMKGRTGRSSNLSFETINSILLPRRHVVTDLVVKHYHEKFLHANHETVVNEIRQLFVIPHLRTVLNHIITVCQHCKLQRAVPRPPEMGDLPKARLAAFVRPFSYVGIDFFGPFEVVVGRRVEKRWGCLFTCMTIRAIHIEVAYSLSKDSCMICLRKLIARRGMPIEIRTDNGTNFIGVRNELQQIVRKIPFNEIISSFEGIKWMLNPPAAPHMGGCWERQVRSIKNCLESKMPTRRPDDENLSCYLVEVENMINSRPLTYLPIRPEEPEALTPNHFLLGTSGGTKPFMEIDEPVLSVRRNYKLSQEMALFFWKRWLKEYLPELTRRTKWYEKVKPIEIGDLVVIMDERKRNSWAKGVVVEVVLDKSSNQVRQAKVKTVDGVYTRPATKIAVLDIEQISKSETSQLEDVSTY